MSDPDLCDTCGHRLDADGSHVRVSRVGADLHRFYHPGCCPADHSKPGHLMAQLAAEDKAAGRKTRTRGAA